MSKGRERIINKKGKWGRRLITFGLCSNCFLLICISILSTYQNRLISKEKELKGYLRNLELIEINIKEYSMLAPIQNLLVVMSNLAHKAGAVHPVDIKSLRTSEKTISATIEEKVLLAAKITCFVTEYYDHHMGENPNDKITKKLAGKSQNELIAYINKHGKAIRERSPKIGLEAMELSKMKNLIEYFQYFFAIWSGILILLGTIFLYQYEDLKDEDTILRKLRKSQKS